MAAVIRRSPDPCERNQIPRLVAVSKLKPIQALMEAYACGQRYFGENYIKELEFKSNCQQILEQCPDMKFHFIGNLQTNKVNQLLRTKNLHMVETIDSIKLADLLDRAIGKRQNEHELEQLRFSTGLENPPYSDRLKVLIQVNTSGEEQKNGIIPEKASELANHIVTQCKWLRLAGFMTIGRQGGWSGGPNQDFILLGEVRKNVAQELAIDVNELELSMGMSSDFEEAIEMGSTNVRVGTLIFGERPRKESSPPVSAGDTVS